MKVIDYKKDINNLKELIITKNRNSEQVLLHLGAGSQLLDDYINIDINDHTITHFVLDLREMVLPIESIDAIQLHHVFEHFTEYEGEQLLLKWYSWLKKDGELIISVPNLQCSIDNYCFKILSFDKLLDQIYRGRCRNDEDTDKSAEWRNANTHKFGYSPTSLVALLKRVGFSEVSLTDVPLNRKGDNITMSFKAKK